MGQYRDKFENLHRGSEANDNSLVGGNGELAIHAILGRNSDYIGMSPEKPQTSRVQQALTRAFKERRLIIVGTPGDKAIPISEGISHSHCLAVIGWNGNTNHVTIWNPLGNSREPKESGPNAGYKTVNGVFSMHLHDFTRTFSYMHIENDTPYKHKK